jgi:hypothetical protein
MVVGPPQTLSPPLRVVNLMRSSLWTGVATALPLASRPSFT